MSWKFQCRGRFKTCPYTDVLCGYRWFNRPRLNQPYGISKISSSPLMGIRVKLSDLVGWHGQTLFVRAFLATHNGKKSTGNVAGNCPPLAGDQGGGKGTRKQCGKNQKPMKPIITLTTNGCDRLQTICVRK